MLLFIPKATGLSTFVLQKTRITVTFHIIDYGKGIDEQTIPLILKGEYTAPRTSDTHRGMGIGLSICNTIVQAHGGKIAAHNHADGAEFLFTLPKGDT